MFKKKEKFHHNYIPADFSDLSVKDILTGEELDPVAIAIEKGLPAEFQRLFFVINQTLIASGGWKVPDYYHNRGMYEFISGHPFNLYGGKMDFNRKKRTRKITDLPSAWVGDSIRFSTDELNWPYDKILDFFQKLVASGYYPVYEEIIFRLFGNRFKDYDIALASPLKEFKNQMRSKDELTRIKPTDN